MFFTGFDTYYVNDLVIFFILLVDISDLGFSTELAHFGRNLKEFQGFHSRFPDIIKDCMKSIVSDSK